jgi:hypothetical protein
MCAKIIVEVATLSENTDSRRRLALFYSARCDESELLKMRDLGAYRHDLCPRVAPLGPYSCISLCS